MKDSISQTIVSLFESEMFYAEVVSQMRRFLNPDLPAVAGVCIKNQIELHINPTLFEKLPLEQRVAILKHECEHILRDHIGRMKDMAPEVFKDKQDGIDSLISGQKFKAMNIAADCAINCAIPNIPEWGCFPKTFNLPDGQTAEWYLEKLKDNEKMKSLTQFDEHSLWAESEGQKEMLKEKIRQAVNKAAKKTRAAGKMTAENEMIVDSYNSGHTVNWKQQLRRFVARSIETKIESSRKKRNRRYGISIPGEIKTEDLHIGVAKDSSGSVSNEAYIQFMNEIDNIAKYAKVTVIEADCEIKDSYVHKKGQQRRRVGCGGTAYQPAFNYFNKDKTVDAVIYFGDMDSSDKPKKPRYPVLWAVVGEQDPPADFGSKITIKVLKEE